MTGSVAHQEPRATGESSHIKESVKLSLSKQLEYPNPFLLRKIMDKKMKKIFSINNNPR